MTEKEKLKSYYKYKPPLKFIKNKFFSGELKNLYEDNVQILYLQYALQILWVAEVVWIEDVRLSRSRVQDLIMDELSVQDLIKVVQQYQLTYKNPWEQALVVLIVLINRLWFSDREENKYEVMRIKNASSISFAGKHYQAYCNKKLKDNFDTYAQGNFFPLPKAVFNFDLCAEEIALYAYLMHIEDRKTFACIAKYSTIGAALKMSNNTVAKYLKSLERKGFISMYQTTVQSKTGRVQNGCMKITIEPLQPLLDRQKEREEAEFYKSLARVQAQRDIENYDRKHNRKASGE